MLQSASPLYDDLIPGGSHWSFLMRRGHVLRLIDEDGGVNVGMLLYNPDNPLERYNMPDTLKNQHTFRLTQGHVLLSDMGRVFASIIRDDLGWHDTVCGTSNARLVEQRWGRKTYQEARNLYHRNGRTSFLNELAKYGLGKKDLTANLNWFSRVQTDDDGNLSYVADHSRPGAAVDLRFEMDTLVLMHTCPHPLNTATEFPRTPVLCEIFKADPVGDDDFCRNFRPENQRGFENNRLYHLGLE